MERTEATLTYVSPKWWPNNAANVLVIPTAHLENVYEGRSLLVPSTVVAEVGYLLAREGGARVEAQFLDCSRRVTSAPRI